MLNNVRPERGDQTSTMALRENFGITAWNTEIFGFVRSFFISCSILYCTKIVGFSKKIQFSLNLHRTISFVLGARKKSLRFRLNSELYRTVHVSKVEPQLSARTCPNSATLHTTLPSSVAK